MTCVWYRSGKHSGADHSNRDRKQPGGEIQVYDLTAGRVLDLAFVEKHNS